MLQGPSIVIALLIVNVTMRFFTNGIGVLPRILNVADAGIVGLLGLVLIREAAQGRARLMPRTVIRRMTIFGVVTVVGTLLNFGYFKLQPAASQLLMLFEPLVLFVAIVSLRFGERDVAQYCRVLRALIILEVGIGILQFPKYLITRESESLMGTFQHNGEQYAAFLLIGILYLLGLRKLHPARARRYTVACLVIGAMILCIDNKASWLGLTVALVVVLKRLSSSVSSHVQRLAVAAAIVVVLGVGYLFISRVSNTLYKFQILAQVWKEGEMLRLGKIKAYVDILRSHTEHPYMALVGSGLSTFYSRGCRQFYLSPKARAKMYRNAAVLSDETDDSSKGKSVRGPSTASNSMGGMISVNTRTPYYDRYYGDLNQIFAIGTTQVDSPYSPYAGLLGETGLLGTAVYLSIYWLALKKLSRLVGPAYARETWFPLAVAAYGFCVYLLVNSLWGPFIETTRYTTILWSFIGLLMHAESQTNQRRIAQEADSTESPNREAAIPSGMVPVS